MKKTKWDFLGFSFLTAAFIMLITFFAICIKKKNILAAIAAATAVCASTGVWILSDKKNSMSISKLFVGKADIKYAVPSKAKKVATPAFEIPVDEEATEEDFNR